MRYLQRTTDKRRFATNLLYSFVSVDCTYQEGPAQINRSIIQPSRIHDFLESRVPERDDIMEYNTNARTSIQ
jgi:hypothetical protein